MSGEHSERLDQAFAIALRRLRLAAGKSQEQLGLDADIPRNFVSLMELGQSQPTITTIAKLARALAMRPSELVAQAESELDDRGARTLPRQTSRSAK